MVRKWSVLSGCVQFVFSLRAVGTLRGAPDLGKGACSRLPALCLLAAPTPHLTSPLGGGRDEFSRTADLHLTSPWRGEG